jgi:hypothetical protein
MNKTIYWASSSGAIELALTLEQASKGYHQGQCDLDIAELRSDSQLSGQLDKLTSAAVRETLKEYGAWNDVELSDHGANLDRLLWIACADLVEQETEQSEE